MGSDFIGAETTGKVGVSYACALFKYSGYDVADFGIEHQADIIQKVINKSYVPVVNQILHAMPDLIVLDKDSKEAMLVEVKYHRRYDLQKFRFKYRRMKNYIDYWPDAILLLIRDTAPHYLAVRVRDIDWHSHFNGSIFNDNEKTDLWDLSSIACDVRTLFPKITDKSLMNACSLLKRDV